MNRRVCPFHADDDVVGVPSDVDGGFTFTCARTTGHPSDGDYVWHVAPSPPDLPAISGLAAELGLDIELPRAVAEFAGQWVEFGVVEETYARQNPQDFRFLVARYGHTAIKPTQYSASAFLGRCLGTLADRGSVLYHDGPATGRWDYNTRISWWSVEPRPDWGVGLSWYDSGLTTDYVTAALA